MGPRGAVAIRKQYVGKHQVSYQGVYDGEGTMAGDWFIGDLTGKWIISIRRQHQAVSSEIRDMFADESSTPL